MKTRYAFLLTSAVALLLLLITLPSLLQPPVEPRYRLTKEGNPLLTLDDFQEDPAGRWTVLNDARWDREMGRIILASTRVGDTGVIWSKKMVKDPFTVEFTYYVGGGNGGNGFVFMFYKEGDYEPGAGRYIGFACRPEDRPCPKVDAPGYGVEWDTLYNNGYGLGDPSPSHIALIKDNVNNHLAYVNDSSTKDDRWHRAKIVVREDTVQVYVDGKKVLGWRGDMDRSYSRMGFGASSLVHYDWHIIDDFKLYGNTVKVKGLQTGWIVELRNGEEILASGRVSSGSDEAVLDVAEKEAPLKGHFRIYSEAGETVFESQVLEIWGGETFTLTRSPG